MDFSKVDSLKSVINRVRPFVDEMLYELKSYFRVELTYTSNALEGNAYSFNEAKVLLEESLTAGGKLIWDAYETVGHANAYDFMLTLIGNSGFTEDDILRMHRLFYDNINLYEAGVYRTRRVSISGSRHSVTKVANIEPEMKALIDWINSDRKKYHPVEFAALLHKKFVFIHPFIDGNGRVSRLLMNAALLQDGYTFAIIPPERRGEYITHLDNAHENDSDFIQFIADCVYNTQNKVVELLHISV